MSHTPPKLSDLLERYLDKQSAAHRSGLAAFDPGSEVVPFEAGPVQPVDPQSAFREAVAVLDILANESATALQAPSGWPNLVAAHEPIVSIAFCVGNFPQLMRNLHTLLQQDLTGLRPAAGNPIDVPELLVWADKIAAKHRFPEMLLGVGALRLGRHYEAAEAVLRAGDAQVPEQYRSAWENERAALAWHCGKADQALAHWREQQASVPVLFNQGMAALFMGRFNDAGQALTQAVDALPEASAWHHLGHLYLTLAQARA